MDLEQDNIPKQENKIYTTAATSSSFLFDRVAQLGLRIVVIGLTLAGAILMATSKQSVTVFGIIMEARYTYSSAFRFKVIADSIVCGLTLLSVLHVTSLNQQRTKSNLNNNYFHLLLHDLVNVLMLLSGCSAATAIGYIGKSGQAQTGWVPICDRVPKFCDKITISIASSFVAVIALVVLTVMSAYKLKSVRSP